jgi:hypothetical protein
MGILAIVGVLFGMIIGQFFKWYVLFPACGLAIVLVLANPLHMDNSLLGSFLHFVVLTTCIQIGYVIGLVVGNFRRAPLEETWDAQSRRDPSGGSEGRDKRAA